nr:protein kinase [Deltaproteobacteria bacterium]
MSDELPPTTPSADAVVRPRGGTFASRVIAGRYVLELMLGAGGQAEVWEANDPLTRSRVAVKVMHSSSLSEGARVRREIATLRRLRVPGVVTLLDEGVDDGDVFLVMERVDGTPFPGRPSPLPWEELRPTVTALLETLSRIHAAGVIHRDFKPGNVLVCPEGRPTLLDFGVSWESLDAQRSGQGEILGTPLFLAPEQIQGGDITPRTDLYALGVMLYLALSGESPVATGTTVFSTFWAKVNVPATPLRERAPFVPEAVATVVDALLSRRPEERPESAAEVLSRLRGSPPRSASLPALLLDGGDDDLLDDPSLRSLFTGTERLFHIPSDAARALRARTDGRRARVLDELLAWERAGLVRRDGERFAIDREILDRLATGFGTARPLRSTAAGARPVDDDDARLHALLGLHPPYGQCDERLRAARAIASEGAALALHHARSGALGHAAAVLDACLVAVRQLTEDCPHQGDAPESALLSVAVEVALAEGTPRFLDRAVYELSRVRCPSGHTAALDGMLRAALMLSQAGDRALTMIESVAPFADPALERRRLTMRVMAARRWSLTARSAWSTRRLAARRTRLRANALGRLRYRQGRFEEAAALLKEAAAWEPWATARLDARVNAASAAMECFRLDDARSLAEEARRAAARCRHPYYEARAEWILRAVAYRTGRATSPDLELLDAVSSVGLRDVAALLCMNEAAVAWRAGDAETARSLSARALRQWSLTGWVPGLALVQPLAMLCGEAVDAEEERLLVGRAKALPLSRWRCSRWRCWRRLGLADVGPCRESPPHFREHPQDHTDTPAGGDVH